MTRAPVLALLLVALLGFASLPVQGQGGLVTFPLERYNDTLFANVDVAYRTLFDARGDIWYSTTAGVVHVDVDTSARELFTKMEGLPSSLTLGMAIDGETLYAGTDLGLAIINVTTGAVTNKTALNSPLLDPIVREVAIDGEDVWLGTQFGGVVIWNRTTDLWTSKNTSSTVDYPHSIRRIIPTPTAVWVATDGDGLWKYVRANQTWLPLVVSDGLPSNSVLAVAERGNDVWIGTDRALVQWRPYAPHQATSAEWVVYNETNGMPDGRTHDIDVIPTEDGGDDVFAATRQGLWQLDPETGAHETLAQSFGILGAYVYDSLWSEELGWVFGTTKGVSLLRGSGWNYYATGPTVGPSNGPMSYRFTAAASAGDYLWFGTDEGIAAFDPGASRWYNLGSWVGYPGGPVNHLDVEGSVTWIASNTGAYGYDKAADEHGAWIYREVEGARNLVYGLDAGYGEVWIGLFGNGLIMQNLTTEVTRSWNADSPIQLPDDYVTDVRLTESDVWVGTSVGLVRLDRIAGTIKATYTAGEGVPGSGVVFRTIPEGPVVWVGTRDGGVARLDVASGAVTRVWNDTTVPGFPMDEVRSMLREGGRLWVGTKDGLARIDVQTGAAKWWNQSSSGLVQQYVGGITHRDGVLYLATASGIARFDVATEAFLPMRDGEGVVRFPGQSGPAASPINVRIDSPRDGIGVTGAVEIRGAASRLGAAIDRVEVRIGLGEWTTARGTESWSLAWDSSSATPNEPITIAARAFVGENVSREATILVTPVKLPDVPLTLEHTPIESARAGRAVLIAAKVTGDEPLSASLYYRVPGRDAFTHLPMARQGALFTATIPAKDVQEGRLHYFVQARSGLLEEQSPSEGARGPRAIEVGPAPRLAVAVEGPSLVDAKAGEVTRFHLTVENVGTEDALYVVSATGVRASWLEVSTDPISLGPGEQAEVEATLRVPARAFADTTTLTFDVRHVDAAAAEASQASVPIRIQASEATETPTPAPTKSRTPLGAAPVLAALGAAAVLLARRWRS